jgi:hypothetical protein
MRTKTAAHDDLTRRTPISRVLLAAAIVVIFNTILVIFFQEFPSNIFDRGFSSIKSMTSPLSATVGSPDTHATALSVSQRDMRP